MDRRLLLAMLAVALGACGLDFSEFETGGGGGRGHGGNGGTSDPSSGGASGGGDSGDGDPAGGMGGNGGTGGDEKPDAGPGVPSCDQASCDLEDATCEDSSGTAICTCADGYEDVNGDGSACEDADECAPGGAANCNVNADCMNTPGAFACECKSGWNGDGVTSCEQNVLCDDAAGSNCASQTATCEAIDGTMYCVCADGYRGDGVTCEAIDECGDDLDDCHSLATCMDTTPGFDCDCPDGYTGEGHGADGCADIDECDLGQDDCDEAATCNNIGGSFTCTCPSTHWGNATGDSGCMVKAVSIAAGGGIAALAGSFTCAALATGAVKCWGFNGFGQLGQGDQTARGDGAGEMGDDLDPIPFEGNLTAKQVTAGEGHACAVFSNGAARCWGGNSGGLLLLGKNSTDVPALGDGAGEMAALGNVQISGTIAEIRAGYKHTCARSTTGEVKCWGGNDAGQLGRGNTDVYGDDVIEDGHLLGAIPLGGALVTAVSISVGSSASSTCAALSDGALKCWGGNASGVLGQGDGNARGDQASEMGTNLNPVSLDALAVHSSSLGQVVTCATYDLGSVKCWGAAGALGLNNKVAHGAAAGTMGANLDPVFLGTLRSAEALSSGSAHTCALLDNGTVKCWGSNNQGLLGIGAANNEVRGDDANEMQNLPAVSLGTGIEAVAISSGSRHNCALFDNGGVKCWGNNGSGALGLGDATARGLNTSDMGDNLEFVDLGH